jgi:hypothetical protein
MLDFSRELRAIRKVIRKILEEKNEKLSVSLVVDIV